MSDLDASQHDAIIDAVASNLRIDAATTEVLRSFDEVGVRGLLLKGPALSDWYADDRARAYLDCDLWVAPSDRRAAAQALARLGFSQALDQDKLPVWWQEHASSWCREADRVTVDLHQNLQGVGVEPAAAWEILTETTATIVVAGRQVKTLSLPAKVLYVTLHAGHHGQAWGKALSHLERALASVEESTWRSAAALARRLDALDSFAAGLRLVPAGAAVAERIGVGPTQSVRTALHASTPPPLALGFEQLASAAGWRARVTILARKLVPPPAFVRHWWPPAARSRTILVVGYLYRPIWLLGRAPDGFRAWRWARRQVGRD